MKEFEYTLVSTHKKNPDGQIRADLLRQIKIDHTMPDVSFHIEYDDNHVARSIVVLEESGNEIGNIAKKDMPGVVCLINSYGSSLNAYVRTVIKKEEGKYTCKIAVETPPNPINFVAFDFETANYDKCSPCSLGITIVKNGEIIKSFSYLIKPPSGHDTFIEKFTALHGISPQDVKDKPGFPQIWNELYDLFNNTTLVAHNMPFDLSVLSSTLEFYHLKQPQSKTLCSLSISRLVWPFLESHKLSNVANHLGIILDHHQAESDSAAAATIILRACQEKEARDLDELLGITNYQYGYIDYTGGYSPYIKAKEVNHQWGKSSRTRSAGYVRSARRGCLTYVCALIMIFLIISFLISGNNPK